MPSFQFYTCLIFSSVILWSCQEHNKSLDGPDKAETSNLITKACLSSFEMNTGGTGDTINKIYGKDFKEGHWISFELITTNLKTRHDSGNSGGMSLKRIKREEGYYFKNKKEGFWKFYNFDGSVSDSVEFKNDTRVIR